LGEKPGTPNLRQRCDIGEMPVPSLRQVFDKLGEMDFTPPEPPALPTKPPQAHAQEGRGPPAMADGRRDHTRPENSPPRVAPTPEARHKDQCRPHQTFPPPVPFQT